MLVHRKLSINVHLSFNNITDYGVDKYDIGAGFGHFGIAVDDVSFFLQTLVPTTMTLSFTSFFELSYRGHSW